MKTNETCHHFLQVDFGLLFAGNKGRAILLKASQVVFFFSGMQKRRSEAAADPGRSSGEDVRRKALTNILYNLQGCQVLATEKWQTLFEERSDYGFY